MGPDDVRLNAVKAWLRVAADPTIVRRALATSMVVGTILTLMNRGNAVLTGQLGSGDIWPIAVTFGVPFAVATVSSVAATTRRRDECE